jgi:hypothetical protein
MPPEKLLVNIDGIGNTAASVFIALTSLLRGRIPITGERILLGRSAPASIGAQQCCNGSSACRSAEPPTIRRQH